MSDGSPLIINDGERICSLESLHMLMCSVLGTTKLDPDMEALAEALYARAELMASSDSAIAALRESLIPAVRNAQGDDPATRELLSRVLEHENQTWRNRSAYSAADKLNPRSVWWPDPTRSGESRSIYDELPYARTFRLVDRATPIGSAGSCFAMEIAQRLQQEGYNYVVAEPNPNVAKPYHNSCARWGTIFNVPAFRQLVERAFGYRKLPKILWSMTKDGQTIYRDPFREDVEFESVEEYEADYQPHLEAARKALIEPEVFVITLGVNEVWYLKSDGSVFSRNPWKMSASLVEHKVLSVDENVAELQKMLDLWRLHNPKLKLIVSVSPVPLLATFQGHEKHVAAATCLGKSTLRVAAETFVARNQDVYYFPSFEQIMYCTAQPWQEDGRHVTREAVSGVMRLFDTMFVYESSPRGGADEKTNARSRSRESERRVQFLHVPDWGSDDLAYSEEVVRNYLSAFAGAGDVNMLVWLPVDAPVAVGQADQWLRGIIEPLGFSAESCPDVSLVNQLEANEVDRILECADIVVCRAGKGRWVGDIEGSAHSYCNGGRDELLIRRERCKEKQSVDTVLGELRDQYAHPEVSKLIDRFGDGYHEFLETGRTPHEAYAAMRQLYCVSNGLLNARLLDVYRELYPPRLNAGVSTVLAPLSRERDAAVERIQKDGFYVFEQRLPEDICQRLRRFALEIPTTPRGVDSQVRGARFDPDAPVAVRHDIDEQSVLTNRDVQALLMDPGLIDIARSYLRCEPVADLACMWWSAAAESDGQTKSEAAQMFHFDMDRPNFLKFFVYLTNVSEANGPHCYVRGSHRDKRISPVRDGRYTDAEIKRCFASDDIASITGPTGTIIAADTAGFHKGNALQAGHRLVLQFEFASTLFGAPYLSVSVDGLFRPEFRQAVSEASRVFTKFELSPEQNRQCVGG